MNIFLLLTLTVLLFPFFTFTLYLAVVNEFHTLFLVFWAMITVAQIYLIVMNVKFYLYKEKELVMEVKPVHVQALDIAIVNGEVYNLNKILGRNIRPTDEVRFSRYIYKDLYTSPFLEINDGQE